MEIINYILSILLVLIAILFKLKPNFIPGYNSLSKEKKNKFPINKLLQGFCFTAFINPVVAYNIRFGDYYNAANFSFLFTISLGVFITISVVTKKMNSTKD